MVIALDPRRTALLNVHWQEDLVRAAGPFGSGVPDEVIGNVARLVDSARAAGVLVLWSRAAFRPGHPEIVLNSPLNEAVKQLGALVDGTPGAEIIAEFAPREDEPVISHPGTTAFGTTIIEPVLRARGIETLLVTGVATNISVEGTARDAVTHGYRAVIVSDACASGSEEAHLATLRNFPVLGRVAAVDELEFSPAAD